MSGQTSEIFVGRLSELRYLRDVQEQAVNGRSRIVFISGEPGIGKTRLVEELCRNLNVPVWRGACWEGQGSPSYWPWVQALRSCMAERESAQEPSGVAEVDRLLSGCVLPQHTVVDMDQSRFLLFDAVIRLLRGAAAPAGAVLVLDDLQWADPSSLLLLRFLARELRTCRLLVLCTYRDVETDVHHPLRQLLGNLNDERLHLSLQGLRVSEVSQLVSAVGGHPPTAKLLSSVCVETNGNPLYVHEVVRYLVASDQLAGVPSGVRAVIDRRIGRLTESSAHVLRAAAVLGTEFDPQLVCTVLATPPEEVARGLAEAVAARLVDRACGKTRFVHALTREVLLANLAPEEQASLHERAAATVEAQFAKNLGPHLAQIAHHLETAGTNRRLTIEYLTRAAQRAMDMLAYEEAAEHATRAITVLGSSPDPTAHFDLLLVLGQARRAVGEATAARAALRQAAEVAEEVGLPDRLARAALGMTDEYTVGLVDDLEVRTLETAVATLPDTEQGLRARVMARLAKALLFTPDIRRREALAEEATALARRCGDPTVLAGVLFDRHVTTWGSASAQERLAIATEIVGLAERSPDPALVLHGRALRMSSLLELSDMTEYDAEIERYDRHTRRFRLTRYQWLVPLMRATQAIIEGRLSEVDALTEEGLRLGRLAGQESAELYLLVLRLGARTWEGERRGELEEMTRKMAAALPTVPGLRTAIILTQLDNGKTGEAQAEFERLATHGFHRLPRDATWLATMTSLAVAAHCLDDSPRARELYDLLGSHERCVAVVSHSGIGCSAPVAYYRGLLATTAGQYDAAVAHLENAVRISSRMGAPVFTANAYAKLAAAITMRDGPSHRAAAAQQEADRGIRALGLKLVHHPVIRTQPRVHAEKIVDPRQPDHAQLEIDALTARRANTSKVDAQHSQSRNKFVKVVGHGSDQYEFQVYLCHSSQDKDIVRRIRDRLEQNKIRCWFDEKEMPAGHSARRRMEQGLLSSRYLLVCASSNLPTAPWANQEIDAVLRLDVENQTEPKVLVLKLNGDSVETSIPPLLRGKRWLEYQRPGDFDHLVEILKRAPEERPGLHSPAISNL